MMITTHRPLLSYNRRVPGLNWPSAGEPLQVFLDLDELEDCAAIGDRIVEALERAWVPYTNDVRPVPDRGHRLAWVITTSPLFTARSRAVVLAAIGRPYRPHFFKLDL